MNKLLEISSCAMCYNHYFGNNEYRCSFNHKKINDIEIDQSIPEWCPLLNAFDTKKLVIETAVEKFIEEEFPNVIDGCTLVLEDKIINQSSKTESVLIVGKGYKGNDMGWGIAETASENEKIKAEFNDHIKGLNSTGDINYKTYCILFDITMPLFDKMYRLGYKEEKKKPQDIDMFE